MTQNDFKIQFEKLTDHPPFPWQARLYKRFIEETIPQNVMLPTGLGKTSVIAVWLLALANNQGRLPRRLVYVVNRRTVVDQTTNEVERLRERAGAIGINDLAISTLRGQFADNGEWCADPSRPAVICGTVDMIGSRLLFSGYRIGFKSRPLHAGFLGQDALLVHDESHLEPAFQQLVETIQAEQKQQRQGSGKLPWPQLQVMSLSATTRANSQEANSRLTLCDEDDQHAVIRKRITAAKTLHLHACADEKKQLVSQIIEQAMIHSESGDAVLVYARRVSDALHIFKQLGNKHPGRVAPLTGTMRGHERDQLVRDNAVFARFMPESDRPRDIEHAKGTVYLVCTSAGEVGVNLSADHMVCDLSTFDSMAQRLGRVNRFGDSHDTRVDVVHPESFDKKDTLAPSRQATLALLNKLNGDASPKALRDLMEVLSKEDRAGAFAPIPNIPQATDILFDAWAMTTIRGELPGRPPVAPYLHGIAEWEPQRTSVAWREEVEWIIKDGGSETHQPHRLADRYPPADLLDDYPLKPHELLSDTTERVYKALTDLAKHADAQTSVWLVSERGEVTIEPIKTLLSAEKKRVIERLEACTILLPPTLGGLANGMLDGTAKGADDVADEWYGIDSIRRRKRRFSDQPRPKSGPVNMALIRTIDTRPNAEEFASADEENELNEDSDGEAARRQRFWHWYVRPADAEDATPASIRPVTWQDHTDDVVKRTTRIVTALDMPNELQQAVTLAAEFHDLGKQRELWQRSIGNPNPTDWYAKPGKHDGDRRWQPRRVSNYRHEFGSLIDVLDKDQAHRTRLNSMTDEMRDLTLHLIAAHHGYARPHFPLERTIDPNHSQSEADAVAVEAMRRYARLQYRYGRWGLAYLESLLRAADWAASAEPTRTDGSAKEISA